jgi:RNA polymerase sigma-70 factor (ECF subfamily)
MGLSPFDAIVTTHHGEIYRYLRRVTTRAIEAEDLAQETFLRAYRAYHGLTPDANVRAWLFAIATNLMRNHFRAEGRRRRAHAAVGEVATDVGGPGPEEARRFNETRALLDSVVTRLPLKQRLAFTLRKVHELEYDAIGRSLGCSAESARAHVFQALKKIRVSLNGHDIHLMESRT